MWTLRVLLCACVAAVAFSGFFGEPASAVAADETNAIPGAVWSVPTLLTNPTPIVGLNGDVVAESCGGDPSPGAVQDLSSSGGLLWSIPSAQVTCLTPTVTDANGVTYTVAGAGVQARDRAGNLLWSTSTGGYTGWRAGAALGWNGSVFFSLWNGLAYRVMAFDEATGIVTLDLPLYVEGLATYAGGFIAAGPSSVAYYDYNGTLLHQYTGGAELADGTGFSSAPGANGSMFLAGYSTACAISVDKFTPNGEVWTWTDPTATSCETQTRVAATPDGGAVLTTTASPATIVRSLSPSGALRWSRSPAPPTGTSSPGGSVSVDANGVVAALTPYTYTCPTGMCVGDEVSFLNSTTGDSALSPVTVTDDSTGGHSGVSLAIDAGRFYLGLSPNGTGTSYVSAFDVAGLAQDYRNVVGAPIPTQPPARTSLTLTPLTGSDPVGASHALTAQVKTASGGVFGAIISFTVTSGPCQGKSGTGTTDASGNAEFVYSCSSAGTDTITAATTVAGQTLSASATEQWTSLTASATSATWAGYVLNEPMTSASAAITVPSVACNTTGVVSAWVGLDGILGNNSNTVEQDGVTALCSSVGGKPTFSLWYELFKKASKNPLPTITAIDVPLRTTLSPGDQVDASVSIIQPDRLHGIPLGLDKVLFVIHVYRSGTLIASWDKTVTEPLAFSPKYNSGECVVETPSFGAFPLPNFGTAVFSACSPIIDAKNPSDLTKYDIVRGGSTLATTSAIPALDGNFTVTWAASR